jgi:nifR3 family TIM-barrel protein
MRFDWKNLPKPFFCLAPMEGATDSAFRQIVNGCGRPQVRFTEFVNVEGLMSVGAAKLEQYLIYDPSEQPLIVQLWGLKPKNFELAASNMVSRGFAGVDINMGCPDKSVIKKGAGGALINNPELAQRIIAAVKRGAAGRVPVSVKIRIGYKQIETEKWARFILGQGIDALSVHGRTVAELSKVPNHWEEIGKVVEIKNKLGLSTKIIGNGDVESTKQGIDLAETYGVDGIMIGRGVFKNPAVFANEARSWKMEDRIKLLRKHLDLYEAIFSGMKPYEPMKRFFKIYIQGFEGAVEIREKLMQTNSRQEAEAVLKDVA